MAACEAGLALSLILALYQKSKSLDIEFWTELREADLPPPMLAEDAGKPPFVPPAPMRFPTADAGWRGAGEFGYARPDAGG